MNPYRLALGLTAALLLATVLELRAADTLTTADIFKQAQAAYAALTSYRDEGKTVATAGASTITTTFTIKLARTNFYCITWEQSSDSAYATTKTKPQSVWSAATGDFLDMGTGARKLASREVALSSATGISGSAAATVPGTFFKMHWGNQLGLPAREKRLPDEKIGDTDCYVFTSTLTSGQTKTLWLGKRDFLIRQVRSVTSAAALKAAFAEAAKTHPEIALHLPVSQDITATETHDHIVVNPTLTPADFTPPAK